MSKFRERGRPWKRVRRRVLDDSDTCWLCGHLGADEVDHVIPISLGGAQLDPANLRPAHGIRGCPFCHRKCNRERGANLGYLPARPATSRDW